MWIWIAFIIVVAVLGGCAVAFGGSASVTTNDKITREVTPDTKTIEDVLSTKEKRK